MSEVTDLVIPLLRKIQDDVATLKNDVAEIKTRLTIMESHEATLPQPTEGRKSKFPQHSLLIIDTD